MTKEELEKSLSDKLSSFYRQPVTSSIREDIERHIEETLDDLRARRLDRKPVVVWGGVMCEVSSIVLQRSGVITLTLTPMVSVAPSIVHTGFTSSSTS